MLGLGWIVGGPVGWVLGEKGDATVGFGVHVRSRKGEASGENADGETAVNARRRHGVDEAADFDWIGFGEGRVDFMTAFEGGLVVF